LSVAIVIDELIVALDRAFRRLALRDTAALQLLFALDLKRVLTVHLTAQVRLGGALALATGFALGLTGSSRRGNLAPAFAITVAGRLARTLTARLAVRVGATFGIALARAVRAAVQRAIGLAIELAGIDVTGRLASADVAFGSARGLNLTRAAAFTADVTVGVARGFVAQLLALDVAAALGDHLAVGLGFDVDIAAGTQIRARGGRQQWNCERERAR
jgi:hypothetical protein